MSTAAQHPLLRCRVPRFIITSWTVADAGPAAVVDAPVGRPPDDETAAGHRHDFPGGTNDDTQSNPGRRGFQPDFGSL